MSRKYHYRPPPASHALLTATPFLPIFSNAAIASSVDLRGLLLGVRNQGQEGCCSGFATAAFREASHRQAAGSSLPEYLSPAYLYGRTRMAEGTFPRDAGATIADEITTLQEYGACPESLLQYNQDPSLAPTPACDVAAVPFRIFDPQRVVCSDPEFIKRALVRGLPVVFGMPVYASFEDTGSDGRVPIPNRSTERLLGGHAMLAVGYDDQAARFTIRNSWGPGWADKGYCYLPYAMVLSWFEAWTTAEAAA